MQNNAASCLIIALTSDRDVWSVWTKTKNQKMDTWTTDQTVAFKTLHVVTYYDIN